MQHLEPDFEYPLSPIRMYGIRFLLKVFEQVIYESGPAVNNKNGKTAEYGAGIVPRRCIDAYKGRQRQG